MRSNVSSRIGGIVAATITAFTLAPVAKAQIVALQNATATFSQTAGQNFANNWGVSQAISGTALTDRGWAVAQPRSVGTPSTAAFQTVSNAGLAGGTQFTFNLNQNYSALQGSLGHLLGRFRLAYTTADRSTFADGLQNGGNVGANAIWTVLNPTSVLSANGSTLSILGDGSVLSGGTNPGTDIYTVTANTTATGITGFRLEALADPSLPQGGPGRQPQNGNFVLSQFTVSQTAASAAPEASPLALVALGGLAGFVAHRRRNAAR